jgi:hypothetical protein
MQPKSKKRKNPYQRKKKHSQAERDGLFKMFGDIFNPGENPLKVHEK